MQTLLQLGLAARKPVPRGFANNEGTDQTAHPRSLRSAALLFAYLKVSYQNLPQAKIHCST